MAVWIVGEFASDAIEFPGMPGADECGAVQGSVSERASEVRADTVHCVDRFANPAKGDDLLPRR